MLAVNIMHKSELFEFFVVETEFELVANADVKDLGTTGMQQTESLREIKCVHFTSKPAMQIDASWAA